jgi:hypothetical protein
MTTISYRQRAMTITKLALIAAVSYRRVLLRSRAVKLNGLLSAVALAACAHTTEMSKAGPATTAPRPGSRAVTFEDLQRAPVPGAVPARSRQPGERAIAATRGRTARARELVDQISDALGHVHRLVRVLDDNELDELASGG